MNDSPPPFHPEHPLWRWYEGPLAGRPMFVPADLDAVKPWCLHRCGPTPDGVELLPSVPVSAFASLHQWSRDMEQWVRPTMLNWKAGDWLATRRP